MAGFKVARHLPKIFFFTALGREVGVGITWLFDFVKAGQILSHALAKIEHMY